jgi:aryl-alcohol dehydrogenase-like predicted oxidoreductase
MGAAALPRRSFGRSDELLSLVGLGTWAMGGSDWAASWGPQDDRQSISTLAAAIDGGVNWVDTAAVYGLGHCEDVIGQALIGRRDQVFVATKCTRRWRTDGSLFASGEPSSIRQECEASLNRLRTDRVDLFQLHHPTEDAPIEATWVEMVSLRKEGKVRFIGVSNFELEDVRRCMAVGSVDSVQLNYNLLNRRIEDDLLPFCRAKGIAVLTYGPMAHGTLSGTFDAAALAPNDWRRRPHPLLDLPKAARTVDALRPLAEASGWTVGQLAIAWVLGNPLVTSAIVGARSPNQIAAIVAFLSDPIRGSLREHVDVALDGISPESAPG